MKITPFQQQVYDFVRMIPEGKTTTYQEVAKAIGRPKAFRAVGTALGRNPFAPQVPCHRVIRSDGGMGGYAWGVSKKIKLLKKEGAI